MTELMQARRAVWDLPVRIIHWLLVITVASSWLTQNLPGDWFAWHRRCGYAVLIMVATRWLWGLLGTRHARFANFLQSPAATWRYARGLLQGRGRAFVGHNPLGAWMVMLLLALLLAQACTGLFANDDIANTGPLIGYISEALSRRLTAWHHWLFDAILIAVGLHVAAVLFYWFVKRQNLILPMLIGSKPAAQVPEDATISSSRSWLALLIAALLGAGLWYVVAHAPLDAPIGF